MEISSAKNKFSPESQRKKNKKIVLGVTLTGALRRGSCPQFSQKSYGKVECRKSTPVQSYDRMLIQSETTKAKLPTSSSEHWMVFRFGGKKHVIGTYRRGTNPLVDMESVATSGVHQKRKILDESGS
ncbi:hypothetical protein V6N13_100072 [Hibiscus sabdariffa]|uniref:Uncharacterized protein n=1 Tax=Hibiscus sabdariffa TaxID=183260 RepID=A0ABR2AWE7_9ROSI